MEGLAAYLMGRFLILRLVLAVFLHFWAAFSICDIGNAVRSTCMTLESLRGSCLMKTSEVLTQIAQWQDLI